MMIPKILQAAALSGCLLIASFACARERITNFHSDITVNDDASMNVVETITVIGEGDQIVHGIVREFPTKYRDHLGTQYRVGFMINEVLQDGGRAPFHVEDASNGKKIYIGDRDGYLKSGTYTYRISYTTTRQLGFFKDHDELYWNVNGTGWRLPIDSVSARIILPKGVPVDAIKTEGYTGRQGERGTDYKVAVGSDGTITFVTTQPFGVREGLTIVVGWPKGFVKAPTWLTHVYYFFYDNFAVLWLSLGLLFLLFYYGYFLRKARRTKIPGTVIPLFYPPDTLSPAEVGYMTEMGYDKKQFAAEVVQLAVKGAITIAYKKTFLSSGTYSLTYKEAIDVTQVPTYSKSILEQLFSAPGETIELKRSYNADLAHAVNAVQYLLSNKLDAYIDNNVQCIIGGIVASIFMFVPVVILSPESTGAGWFVMFIVGYVVINIVPAFSLTTYTQEGRDLQDKIDGFKMFLETTETERMKLIGTPPTKTPELYEQYLPYAMALGVEEQWSQQFAPIFAQLERQGHPYIPLWYMGPGHFNAGAMPAIASDISGSLGSVIASASTPPGRSSGFSSGSGGSGGGSSGGGGGGGGGGGW